MFGSLLTFVGLDWFASVAKKAAIGTSFLLILTAVKFAVDACLQAFDVAPPAAVLSALTLFMPRNFGAYLDCWISAWALAGSVRIYRQLLLYTS